MALSLYGTSAMANGEPEAKGPDNGPVASNIEKVKDLRVVSDSKKIVVTGAVNRAEVWLDNGKHSNTSNVDNYNYPSRLNLTGTGQFNEDITVGGTFELGFYQNSSLKNDVHHAQSNTESESNFPVRIAELFVNSFDWGKLSLGRGYMAAAFTAEETDLSGTRVISAGANVWRLAPGASFFNKTSDSNGQYFVYSNDRLNGVFAFVDSYHRHDRVRYDTPKYYGFMLSGSHGYQSSGDIFDIAGRFAGKFFGIKVAADVAFEHDHSIEDFHYRQFNGSIGVLFPLSTSGKENTGINLFFAAAHKDWEFPGQSDGKFLSGKIGYIDRFFSFGNTAFAADYAWSKGMNLACSDDDVTVIDPAFTYKGTAWGVFLVQTIDVVATEVYLGYREYKLKKINSIMRFDELQAVMAGARVKL